MAKKRARTLTGAERIGFEEEERHLKAAQSIATKRLTLLAEEATATQNKKRQLIDQITTIDSQIQTQKDRHNRQRAQQHEHQKALSKTRETYMKIVVESMAYGSLSQAEGLKLICDETVKEILALDDVQHPRVDHRPEGMQNTCLDIETVLPMASDKDSSKKVFDSLVASNLQSHKNPRKRRENDFDSSPPEIDPIPDLVVVDDENNDDGDVITAWWHGSTGQIELSLHTVGTLSIESLFQAIGVRVSNGKLLLENASSETESVTNNVGRYVDGFLLALHAGVMTGSLDLQYLVGALEDLSFPTSTISHVRKNFATTASLAADSTVEYCRSSFELQVELLMATLSIEDEFVDNFTLSEQDIDYRMLDNVASTWEQVQTKLGSLVSQKKRNKENLRTIIPVGRTILAILASASSARGQTDLSNLTDLYDRINQCLSSTLQSTFEDTFIQMLLTPLFAANVAFACSLKKFHEAYARLEFLMNYRVYKKSAKGVNLFVLSSLLWSQYFQLRICLPPIDLDDSSLSAYRSVLDAIITGRGIKLGHIKPVVGRVV